MELPILFNAYKWEKLNYILDKVKEKTCGWAYLYLSFSGKEILLKSIASALQILTCNVSFFHKHCVMILRGLCKDFGRVYLMIDAKYIGYLGKE